MTNIKILLNTYTRHCEECSMPFTFDIRDVHKNKRWFSTVWYVICPYCRNEINVSAGKVCRIGYNAYTGENSLRGE